MNLVKSQRKLMESLQSLNISPEEIEERIILKG